MCKIQIICRMFFLFSKDKGQVTGSAGRKPFSNLQTFLLAFSGYLISSAVPPPPLQFNLSLSLISDPFFMHYSITPSSQCITSACLSQIHFVLFLLLPSSLCSPPTRNSTFLPLYTFFTRFIISLFPSLVTSLYTLPSSVWSALPAVRLVCSAAFCHLNILQIKMLHLTCHWSPEYPNICLHPFWGHTWTHRYPEEWKSRRDLIAR